MKDKKKVGLVKRIAAGVCALMLAVAISGLSVCGTFYASVSGSSVYQTYVDNYTYKGDVLFDDISLPINNYDYHAVFYSPYESKFWCIATDETTLNLISQTFDVNHIAYYLKENNYWYVSTSSDLVNWSNFSRGGNRQCAIININNGSEYSSNYQLLYVGSDLPICVDGVEIVYNSSDNGKYNSSLGYLQNILCKELYLEDADYAYDPNYLKKIWTFGNTSTAGSDITDGTYSIRHYQQITVRNTELKNPVVKEYDMILMNEFPAASLRYEYMSKDYTSRLEAESGFEPLGFWETSILGQFVFTRNYFQLVRTNADGSVEYGGLVKIDLKGSPAANDLNAEHETTTVTPEGVVDQDGYVGGNMDYIQGSGSDYGQAENNADKEYEKENSSSGGSKDLAAQVENLIAVVMVVPRLIAELFSFLPPWCLDFVGVAFGISIGILVFKLAN